MRAPFRIRVFDKSRTFKFQLSDPETCSVTLRHLGKSTGSLVVPLDHFRAPALMVPGTRVTIDYLVRPLGAYSDEGSWLRVFSGPLWTRQGQGGLRDGVLTLQLEDDIRVLDGVLAWPDPTQPVNSQGVVSRNKSGPAETVIKDFFRENAVTRLGLPITVAPDLGRGNDVSASLRFDALVDALTPLAEVGGLGMTLRQGSGSTLTFDVYETTDRSAHPLSEASGTLIDWAFTSTGPTATRVIVGGGGEGILRGFTSTVATARENEWGIKEEIFVDASGATTSDDLAQAAAEALTSTQAGAGFAITASENDIVRYGKNLFVGDTVSIEITPTFTVTDFLRAVTLSWTDEDGLRVLPEIGSQTASEEPNAALARVISKMYAGLRKLRSNK